MFFLTFRCYEREPERHCDAGLSLSTDSNYPLLGSSISRSFDRPCRRSTAIITIVVLVKKNKNSTKVQRFNKNFKESNTFNQKYFVLAADIRQSIKSYCFPHFLHAIGTRSDRLLSWTTSRKVAFQFFLFTLGVL